MNTSLMGNIFAFKTSRILVRGAGTQSPTQFEGYEGYYASDDSRYYLKKKGSPFDYLIDATTGEILSFQSAQ